MSDFKDQALQLLTDLGLTVNQSKIYLVNLHSGPTTARVLSKVSGIGREDVYRILPSLQEKGLIFKQLSSPTIFESIPLTDGIPLLLKQKEEQLLGLSKNASVFIGSIGGQIEKSKTECRQEIMLLSRDNPERGPIVKAIKHATQTFCFTTRCAEFVHLFNSTKFEAITEELFTAAERGVKIRMILDKPKNGRLVEKHIFDIDFANRLFRHKNFEYRYTTIPPETIIVLVDGKTLFLWTVSESFPLNPIIWTGNHSLVNLAEVYFSSLWEKV